MSCSGCLNLTRRQSLRRDFLRVGSLGLLGGINLPQLLRAADAQKPANSKAQSCILLWLEGGPSQMDTWDPEAEFRASSRSRRTSPGIQVSELLPKLSKRMDKLAIVRSMHTKGQRSSPGDALCDHWPRAESRDAFPQPGSDHLEGIGSSQRDSGQYSRAAVGAQPAIRRVLPSRVPRAGLRPDGAT